MDFTWFLLHNLIHWKYGGVAAENVPIPVTWPTEIMQVEGSGRK